MVQSNPISTVQGWSSIFPKFSTVDFISFYIEIPVMIIMYIAWALVKNIPAAKQDAAASGDRPLESADELTPLIPTDSRDHATGRTSMLDIVDIYTVDLYKDEHVEDSDDELDDEEVKKNLQGRYGWLWKLYYFVA